MNRIGLKMVDLDYWDWRSDISNSRLGLGKIAKRIWLIWIGFIIRENRIERYSWNFDGQRLDIETIKRLKIWRGGFIVKKIKRTLG